MKKGSQQRLDEVWATIDTLKPTVPQKTALQTYYNAMTAAERTTMSAAMAQGNTYAANPLGKANEKVMRMYRRALILILMAKRNSGVVANDLVAAQNALAGNMTGDQAQKRCMNELSNVQSAVNKMLTTGRADVNWGGWDGTKQRPLLAGCAIGRRGANGPGTLGCFLTDGAGAIYILSNKHVLYQDYVPGGGPAADALVIQPPHQLGGSYFDDVATLFAEDAQHDAAIARVKAGITCSNTTVNGIVIAGSAAATNNGAVRKDGCATRLRHGVVTNLNSANVNNGAVDLLHQLLVDIDAGADANPQRIFQIQGDSGSALINHNNEVVALMHGQATAVQAQATHIAPILAHFNLQVMVGVHVAA